MVKKQLSICSGFLSDFSLGRYFRHVLREGDPKADPEHLREIAFIVWPGNTSTFSWRSWWTWLRRGWFRLRC